MDRLTEIHNMYSEYKSGIEPMNQQKLLNTIGELLDIVTEFQGRECALPLGELAPLRVDKMEHVTFYFNLHHGSDKKSPT